MSGFSESDEFFTVAEVATLLKINEQTVRNWIDRGELEAVRAGRRVRIRRTALEAVLQSAGGSRARAEDGGTGPSGDDFWGGVALQATDLAVPAEPTADAAAAADPADG